MGRGPKTALRMSLATSLHALTALVDGKPAAMFGVSPLSMLEGKGVPWFLGTDEVLHHARELLTIGRRIVAWWHDDFAVMENIVSSENVAAIRLLKRWGADVGGKPATYGGLEFVPFRFEQQAIQRVL